MKFQAIKIVTELEDDVQTVAFADSESPEPEKYLILQRCLNDPDPYYFEINSREFSGEGGFESVVLRKNQFEVELSTGLAQKIGITNLAISFAENIHSCDTLYEALVTIFCESDCKFTSNV